MAAPTPPRPPAEIPPSEFAVARAVARRAGRTVFAVVDDAATGRRLAFDRPDDAATLAYWVDHRGQVRLGPAARAGRVAAGAALVRDVARIAPGELAAARDYALIAGRTVFVAELDDADEGGSAMHFAPPFDGTLRYAVRVGGEVLVGEAATAERPASIADPGWAGQMTARLRQLRRLRERAAELVGSARVRASDWSRVERLIPPDDRALLRPATWVGARGPDAARALLAAADREVERLRAWAGQLVRFE